MPKDRSREARLHKINNLLQRRKGNVTTTKEIMRSCEVSERQLRIDIQYLRSRGAQIKTDYRLAGYILEAPFDLATSLALTAPDIYRLRFAAATLTQFRHLDIFKEFEETVEKIATSVEQWLHSSPVGEAILFDSIPQYHGTNWIPIFLQAIQEGRVVLFDYHSFKSPEVRSHEFQPWLLREHAHRWYVIGWLPKWQSITSFALDRIASEPDLTRQRFSKPTDFDPVAHFAHTVGMTVHRGKPIEEVVLHFSVEQAPYFLSKPFHAFEEISYDVSGLCVKMNLIPNFELIRKLAELGSGVKVLAPNALAAEVQQYLKAGLAQYSG